MFSRNRMEKLHKKRVEDKNDVAQGPSYKPDRFKKGKNKAEFLLLSLLFHRNITKIHETLESFTLVSSRES